MPRRIHSSHSLAGWPADRLLTLDKAETHHLRDVLRLRPGSQVEVFDDSGVVILADVADSDASGVRLRLMESAQSPAASPPSLVWTIAAAPPKGNRADWMIEKLSELGAAAYIPLATQRGIVLPEGKNKIERWKRIASEAARQSRRAGVMRIEPLTPLPQAVRNATSLSSSVSWYLSLEAGAIPISTAIGSIIANRLSHAPAALSVFVGPEGGWTPEECSAMKQAGLTPVALTATILRVETAAVAAGAVIAVSVASLSSSVASA